MKNELRNLFIDEESKMIFDARMDYCESGDKWSFIDRMVEMHESFVYEEFDLFVGTRKNIPIIIFGAGKEGKHTYNVLKKTVHKDSIFAFCDNATDRWKEKYCGLPICSIYELLALEKEYLFIIAVENNNTQYAIMHQLLLLKVPQNNIFLQCYGGIFAKTGCQYFDMFEAGEDEVFIDAGAFDGETTKEFIKWCRGKFLLAYMFELNKDMKSICLRGDIDKDRVFFVPAGTWSKKARKCFYGNGSSAFLAEEYREGMSQTELYSLDWFMCEKSEKVTYIKFDVEGSEYESLLGCSQIIKTMKPKLAVCVYHKPDDIIKLTKYIYTLNPEYKLALRHYSSHEWETVLYAF